MGSGLNTSPQQDDLTQRTQPRESSDPGAFPQERSLLPAFQDRGPRPDAGHASAVIAAEATDDLRYPQRNVKRDISRGTGDRSRKEVRDIEDAACNAGMRNPASVLARWPSLAAAMVLVKKALVKAIENDAELQDLPLAVGTNPVKQPPSEAAIARARRRVAKKVGVSKS